MAPSLATSAGLTPATKSSSSLLITPPPPLTNTLPCSQAPTGFSGPLFPSSPARAPCLLPHMTLLLLLPPPERNIGNWLWPNSHTTLPYDVVPFPKISNLNIFGFSKYIIIK